MLFTLIAALNYGMPPSHDLVKTRNVENIPTVCLVPILDVIPVLGLNQSPGFQYNQNKRRADIETILTEDDSAVSGLLNSIFSLVNVIAPYIYSRALAPILLSAGT